jgi:hypothetical protein
VMIDANAMSRVQTLAHERDLPMTHSGYRLWDADNLILLGGTCETRTVPADFRIGSYFFNNLNSRVPRFMLPFLTMCSVRRLRPLESFAVAASLLMFQ